MSEDATGGLPEAPAATEQAAPTLDSIIDGAIAATEQPADGTTETPGERVRDEHGRFVPKSPAAEAPSEGASAAPAASEAPPAEPAKEQQFEPHARWSDTDKAKFAALPPEAKQFALELQAGHEANFTRKAQEFAEFRRTADPLLQAVNPYAEYIAQLGLQPDRAVGSLLRAEHTLRTGTAEQKIGMLADLAGQYGIDLAAMSRGEPAVAHPFINQLQQQVAQLTNRLSSYEQETAQSQQHQALSQIEAFAAAKDEAGQPRYPHYERVKGVMGHLMATGSASTLDDAYQQATAPIREAVAVELSKAQAAEDKRRQEAVEKARKAAPIRTSGIAPGGATKATDLDALIDGAMAQHGFG